MLGSTVGMEANRASRLGRWRWRWTPAATLLSFVALLCIGQHFLAIQPNGDPGPGRGVEQRLLLDGLAAFDAARHLAREPGAPAAAGRALLIDRPVGALLSFSGVGIGTLRFLPGLAALLLAFAAAMRLRRRHGDGVGLITAVVLLLHGSVLAWARTPSVIPLVWLTALGLILLGARRGSASPWLALLLTALAARWVHPTVAFVAPALLIEGGLRLGSVRRFLSGMPHPAALILLTVTTLSWVGLPLEVRDRWVGALLGSSVPSAPPLLAVLPVALPLAWIGFLRWLGSASGALRAGRSFERLLHGAVWIPLALRASQGRLDAASGAELIPFILLLAISMLATSGGRARPLPRLGARGALLSYGGILGTLGWIGQLGPTVGALEAPVRVHPPEILIASGLALLLGVLAAERSSLRRASARGAALLLVIPGIWCSLQLVGHPGGTWVSASEGVERALLPSHRAGGPWARIVSLESDLSWCLSEGEATHVLRSDPGDGERIGRFSALGTSVELVRRPEAEAQRSAFEEGRRQEQRGHLHAARQSYFLVLHADPRHSPSWERVAETFWREGDGENAYWCLLNALLGAPSSGSVRAGLARIYLAHGRPEEALMHLEQAIRVGATPEELAPLERHLVGGRSPSAP